MTFVIVWRGCLAGKDGVSWIKDCWLLDQQSTINMIIFDHYNHERRYGARNDYGWGIFNLYILTTEWLRWSSPISSHSLNPTEWSDKISKNLSFLSMGLSEDETDRNDKSIVGRSDKNILSIWKNYTYIFACIFACMCIFALTHIFAIYIENVYI